MKSIDETPVSNALKQIRLQVAHCLACYGDEPSELMCKLENLVSEWYEKGKQAGNGIDMVCPHCKGQLRVYHLEWTSLTCKHCKKDIYQFE
jgi:hypothetical protein